MAKVAVVYWSGTGNTEEMANLVVEGAKAKGAQVDLLGPDDFNEAKMDEYDAVAFGCPAMGDEVLEEDEFEPMFAACEPKLKGKKIAIFGSYSWNDGQWIRDWNERCLNAGANMACDYVMCFEAPDDEGSEACKALGAALV